MINSGKLSIKDNYVSVQNLQNSEPLRGSLFKEKKQGNRKISFLAECILLIRITMLENLI